MAYAVRVCMLNQLQLYHVGIPNPITRVHFGSYAATRVHEFAVSLHHVLQTALLTLLLSCLYSVRTTVVPTTVRRIPTLETLNARIRLSYS